MDLLKEEFEKALGKTLNEGSDDLNNSYSVTPILTSIARHWFELGFNAGEKIEREACAKIAEIHEEGPGGAEAIRARANHAAEA